MDNSQTAAARAPRYTSYPPINYFGDSFDWVQFVSAVWRLSDNPEPMSLYVHLPFCRQLCYYCGCNRIVSQQPEKLNGYMELLKAEIQFYAQELRTRKLGRQLPVTSIHFGGGSPNSYSAAALADLLAYLKANFHVIDGAEISLEIDPRHAATEEIYEYANSGFTRISIGIQDFAPAVQSAIGRVQSAQHITALTEAAYEAGFHGVNFDLVYGLPFQTEARFRHTLSQLVRLRPSRVSLFSYAHMPHKFPAQRLIADESLPQQQEKAVLFAMAQETLTKAGYEYIGLDHFALPDDELSVAKDWGLLSRGFQGYSANASEQVLGLGVSAVSQIGNCYAQNAKSIKAYAAHVSSGQAAIEKGYVLDADDSIRRQIIMQLMCMQAVNFAAFEERYGIAFERYFANELGNLAGFVATGDVRLSNNEMTVTEQGQRQLRQIANLFDNYASCGPDYSKVA